ncbi:MAG: hypothetical protein AMXMBFR78_13810 [Rubrivivax sp.]
MRLRPQRAIRAACAARAARAACAAGLAALLLLSLAQAAPQVQLVGVMGSRALLLVDGQRQMLAAGASALGVKLLALQGDSAELEVQGQRVTLRVGASPAVLAASGAATGAAREIVLSAGPGGHFVAQGAINGRAVSFLVDTGATTVSMGQAEAQRLGLDLQHAQRAMSSTANGTVPVLLLTLTRVRVGEVEVANVPAVVMPQPMPYVLLGNSFLTRFQMRRENDVMRLELRR